MLYSKFRPFLIKANEGIFIRSIVVIFLRPKLFALKIYAFVYIWLQGAWLADVQTGGSTTSSICGLEISFSSVPQDIDIKVIPSEDSAGECQLDFF